MATSINLLTFPEFELQPKDTAPTRFQTYVKRLNNKFTAMGITQAPERKQCYVGEETWDVFETLTVLEPTDESDECRTAVKAFADYFEPQKCVDHHVYRNRKSLVRISPSSTPVLNCWHAMRVCKFRYGNKTANNSRNLITSPEMQSHRAKPQPGGPVESCSLNGDRR